LATCLFEERIDRLGELRPALHLDEQPISQDTQRNQVDGVNDRLVVCGEYFRDAKNSAPLVHVQPLAFKRAGARGGCAEHLDARRAAAGRDQDAEIQRLFDLVENMLLPGDEGPNTPAPLNQSLRLERSQRTSHRGAGDAVLFHQLDLGREMRARGEDAMEAVRRPLTKKSSGESSS
jgi:hypothetical protein